jgi:hypothetical protein
LGFATVSIAQWRGAVSTADASSISAEAVNSAGWLMEAS